MYLQRVLIFLIGVCVLSTFAKSTEEQAESTDAILKKEIERFEAVKKSFEDGNLNVRVVYTYPFKNEDDTLLKLDTVEIRPDFFRNNPKGPQVAEYDENRVKAVFEVAKKMNLTAVGSRQVFDTEGLLQEKKLLTEHMRLHFKDGTTRMVFDFESEPDDKDDEEDNVQEYISLLKEFELPVEAEIKSYDKSGALIQTDKAVYETKKVTILNSDMTVAMQMKVAEALKRSCSMKSDPKKRILLLCRYLGIQFPDYIFNAVIGDGDHYVTSSVSMKAKFDGQTYFVWGRGKGEDED